MRPGRLLLMGLVSGIQIDAMYLTVHHDNMQIVIVMVNSDLHKEKGAFEENMQQARAGKTAD